jgi:leucyl/phenylalanyl-tRNA--protein transferase
MACERCDKEEGLVRVLLEANRQGYFPMAGAGREIEWFNPARRGVIPLAGFHVPRSLAQRVRSGRFRVTSDRAFEEVIRACAQPVEGGREETWIDERIAAAYTALHRAGHAHSVEAWRVGATGEAVLVGGLYGVHIGGLFAGESMFSRPGHGGTDASKVCLVHLVAHLRQRGFTLLDTQFGNPHLARLGGVEVPRRQYLAQLADAVGRPVVWEPFEGAIVGR